MTDNKKETAPQNTIEQVPMTPLDLERMVELDFVRSTEAAALNAARWLGKGDPQAAHAAAVDALRGTLDSTTVSGTVLFGDGLKPQAGGIEPGEKLGNWSEGSLEIDLAIVPIDGIDLVAHGWSGAVSLLVAARSDGPEPALMPVPCKYMEKIAYGPAVKAGPTQVHLDASVRDNLEIIAVKLDKRLQDLTVAVLDRPRHEKLVSDIRKAGASVRQFSDGDIKACMAPSYPDTGIDVYMGTGGAAEAILAAAAVKCLGGDILARMRPQDDQEKQQIIDTMSKKALETHYHADELARGDNVIFCTTAISDGRILRGVRFHGKWASTESVVMRARYHTVRYIKSSHDLSRKTIRLHGANAEAML